MSQHKSEAERLVERVLLRSVDDVISGERRGWAMGPFYPADSPAHSDDFEVKLWGADPQGGSFNRTWQAHEQAGPELIVVIAGAVRIHLGYRDGDEVVEMDSLLVEAGQTIVLPPGLHRRFSADGEVRALTVRKRA